MTADHIDGGAPVAPTDYPAVSHDKVIQPRELDRILIPAGAGIQNFYILQRYVTRGSLRGPAVVNVDSITPDAAYRQIPEIKIVGVREVHPGGYIRRPRGLGGGYDNRFPWLAAEPWEVKSSGVAAGRQANDISRLCAPNRGDEIGRCRNET
jgi:hypothetical protein